MSRHTSLTKVPWFVINDSYIFGLSWLAQSVSFCFAFLRPKLFISQGHLHALRSWGHRDGSCVIVLPLTMRRMIQLWKIGLPGMAASETEKVSELSMSVQSSQNRGIVGVGAPGRNQWLLSYKITGPVRWQCLQRSSKLLSSWLCNMGSLWAPHVHSPRGFISLYWGVSILLPVCIWCWTSWPPHRER